MDACLISNESSTSNTAAVEIETTTESSSTSSNSDVVVLQNSEDAEVLEEEPRNLLISLLSELKIGIDLSKVPLPTFILEPRSLLEKFTDFMAHGDILSGVTRVDSPIERMIQVTKWYLSGFYFRPKGVKKPYNPILGEIFRSKWNFATGSTAHMICEQISHHPPVSCLYISNRKDGYTITGLINPRSKFLGTSMAVIVDGSITLKLLELNEEYVITFPAAYARGILFGTLLTEIVGSGTIVCKNTDLKVEMDFKSKPFIGGEYNVVSGKIKQKSETIYSFNGKWDNKIDLTNIKKKSTESLWDCKGVKKTPKIIRPILEQEENESQRLWIHVTQAIIKRDQKDATFHKNKLEDEQRKNVKSRKENNIEWEPKFFTKIGDQWVYKYENNTIYTPDEPPEIEVSGIIHLSQQKKN
eukprot:gene3983-4984_t